MEFLLTVLMERGVPIRTIDLSLLKDYKNRLKAEYDEIFDHISSKALDGDIIELQKYIKNKVNGSFSRIINGFVYDYKNT